METMLEQLKKVAAVETGVPLSSMTTLRIGGKAKYVAYPDDSVSLDSLIRIIRKNHLPFKLIGKGSNLLCSDKDYDGVIIRLEKFNDFYIVDTSVVAQAGCSIIAVAYAAMKAGLSGLEFASGIPGSVGGVTFMNAGAYRSSMSDVIDSVFVYRDGKFEWVPKGECGFGYRTSVFQSHPDWIVIAIRLNLEKRDPDEIRALMDSRRERRMASQPLDRPSAGSVFRNPDDVPAWKLIEGIGYRGHRIGDAQVSEKHVNFIVNDGHARAEDFLALTEEIQKLVKEKYGISLHMEVEKFNW
ncbi:MAG: UDP-N-acetylmuramate dehydrogenase [Stecheria intestinalis]|jgi:UDP-N-acetylmuramate dehydrogenase|uniref:UDP-N-acetylmuramate dehydrogenase n=1 Tax=Stecheria intestinalis TaxID=2606630 RepID=UPI0023F09509|nr:UDP-N-acetylmuramate dehydrogenase [Stecheria intestinalis]MCI2155068.1 UDP-N-acetylmuramate dehydrogenase [Solobacterium sp.]MDY3234554.1 UDP-N-acetylmuramate dehydrogenase [Erysipelotrichaceae bacterium]MDY4681254.1 UDP-N-acetylmuramate dehydrogenase [Lachnospiraceae bacterium]MDD5881465.1 UDP-N-acetylmuramate dehydrogenase [Stecheria intestinalis]MDD6366367.1 UDP-N-acetylmuramate dehydrogenase [Stecheria intestinalis]